VNRNQIATAHVGIAELVNVGYFRAGQAAGPQLAVRFVAEPVLSVIAKSRFPQNTFVHQDRAVRSVVIVNRCPLTWFPAKHQHLDELILHHAMA
jgi:hypothetical protein